MFYKSRRFVDCSSPSQSFSLLLLQPLDLPSRIGFFFNPELFQNNLESFWDAVPRTARKVPFIAVRKILKNFKY